MESRAAAAAEGPDRPHRPACCRNRYPEPTLRGWVEDEVHSALSSCLQQIRSVFGTIPDTLEDVWVATALGEIKEARRRISEVPSRPSGNFLYGTNRRFSDHPAADSIAVFRLDEQGLPERVQLVTENIAFPRDIQLDPTGTWLYALNQKGDSIVQFAIDQQTGVLTQRATSRRSRHR